MKPMTSFTCVSAVVSFPLTSARKSAFHPVIVGVLALPSSSRLSERGFSNDHMCVAGATTIDSFVLDHDSVLPLRQTAWLALAGRALSV
jgi:hypothetical protein